RGLRDRLLRTPHGDPIEDQRLANRLVLGGRARRARGELPVQVQGAGGLAALAKEIAEMDVGVDVPAVFLDGVGERLERGVLVPGEQRMHAALVRRLRTGRA